MNIFYNKYMELFLNRVAFTLFGLEIYWYGIIISFSILVAYLVSLYLLKVRGLDKDLSFDVLISAVPLGIIFARLAAVLFDDGLTISEFFNFRSGGMSIIGAIIGGVIGLIILKLVKKRPLLESFDLIATVVILSQGIGRWGNYFNNEIYGQLIENPSFQIFPFAVNIGGNYFEALFFYEFILNIIGFIILLILYKKIKIRGVVAASYLIYYGTIRSILETRRAEKFILRIFGAPFSIICSVLMIIVGLSLLIFVLVKNNKKKILEKNHG